MTRYSLARRVVHACIGVSMLLFAMLPVFAQTDPFFENANEFRNIGIGIRLLVPKLWFNTDVVTKTTLRGPEAKYVSVYPRADKGSRIGAALDVHTSSIEGIFGVPARLRGKLSDADLMNWRIDRLARSQNAFKVIHVRRETHLGLPSLVLEYSDKTYDHFDEISTERYIFKGESVYVISSWYLTSRSGSRAVLETMAKEVRLLTDAEKRYAN